MKASEFIDRLKDLIGVVGDVDVVIEYMIPYGDMELTGFYELAACEIEKTREVSDPPDKNKEIVYTDNYITSKDKTVHVIKVY